MTENFYAARRGGSVDKSAPSKESLERAHRFFNETLSGENGGKHIRDILALEFDAIAQERDEVMEKLVMLTLPELPLCPYHGTEPTPIADCSICWQRFCIPSDYAPKLSQINHQIELYHSRVKRAQEYIALRAEGFETNVPPPKDLRVEFALPGGERVTGKEIDDLMGGTFPVRDDDSEISSYLGWKQIA